MANSTQGGKMANTKEQEDILIRVSDIELDRDDVFGRGGFGEVYRGNIKATGEIVAVKLLISKGSLPKRNIRDLKKEARRLKQCSIHPHIIDMYGALMEQDNYGLVLEFMHFGSSGNFVKEFKVDLPLHLRIICQVVDAMVYLHAFQPPILHLDMKADNILINNKFDAKICDFGLSEWKTVTCSITGGGPRRCTLSHIAPEVFQDINAPSTMALDIYAFGITVWELITGKNVYNGRDQNQIRLSVLDNQRPDIHDLPDYTLPIQQVMTRCWQKDQQLRPPFSVIQKDVEGLYKLYEKQITSAMKSIRRQIIEQYEVNDDEYIHTEYLDEMEVDVTEDVTSHDLPAIPLSPMATDLPISFQPDNSAAPDVPSTPVPVPVDGHKSSNPFVLKISKDDLNFHEKELKKLVPDSVLLDMRDNHENVVSYFDRKLTEYFDDPKSLQELVNNNTVWRSELMRSNCPFFSAISKQRTKHAEFEGQQQQKQYRQEDAQKFYSYTKHQSPEEMNEIDKRRYERMMDLRVCSYGKKLENKGMADKVIKALKEPGYLKEALEEKETKPGEPQRFKVIDPKVKELVKDPMILQIVLSQEPELLDSLMSLKQAAVTRFSKKTDGLLFHLRQHPELIMKLLAEGKTEYRPPCDRPTYRRPDHDMRFRSMLGMMRGPGMYDPSRRFYDSDSDDDDFGFYGRPREPTGRARVPMQALGGQRRQDEMMNQIIMDRRRKEREEREKQNREREEREKRKKEEQNMLDFHRMEKERNAQRQKEMDKRIIEVLKQQSMREARQKEIDRLKELQKQQKEVEDNRLRDESMRSLKGDKVMQSIPDMLKRPHSELRRVPSSPGQSMPSIDQLSMEEERNIPNSNQPSPPKQTKDTPQRPTALVKPETSTSQSPNRVKQEPAGAPPIAGEVGGTTPEKMEIDASTYSPDQAPASGDKEEVKGNKVKEEPVAPMTISHVHGSGAVTHISMTGNLENVPNLQIGNRNKMVVIQGGATNKEDDEPPKRKKSSKARKINLDKFPEHVLNMEQIDKIAMDIGRDWKKLCRAMDLSDAEIEQLEYDYNINGLYEMMYQGIQRWMQKNGRRATLREMVKHLISIERDDLILDLKK